MSKEMYALFTCDEWKSKSSMRLQGVLTSQTKLRSSIAKGIRHEIFAYNDSSKPFRKQASMFLKDWNEAMSHGDALDIASRVDYCFVEPVTANQVDF